MIPGNLITSLLSVIVGVRDLKFNNVSLLLNTKSKTVIAPVYDNNTTVDTSYNGVPLTRNGTPSQGTFSPFSSSEWSGYFNGTNSYLSTPDNVAFQPGTGNFTIECWVYRTSTTSAQAVVYQGAGGTNYQLRWAIMWSSTTWVYRLSSTGEGSDIAGDVSMGTDPGINKWVHLALVRNGNTFTPFINGVAGTTTTSALALNGGGAPPLIIGSALGSFFFFGGYISNLRIVKGTALYTSNFTPSAAPLTAVAGTSLLTLQDNRFKDNSTVASVYTIATATVQPLSPFAASAYSSTNSGSIYFNGSTDYLTTSAVNSSFAFGTGDFTVECWVYPTSAVTTMFVSNNYNFATGQGNWGFYTTVGSLNLIYFNSSSGNKASTANGLIPLNQWSHVTYSRTSGNGKFFINGVQLGTSVADTTSYASTTGTLFIGDKLGAGAKLNGYLSDVRVVNGSSLYNTNFNPSGPAEIVSNTVLLINGTTAGIIDGTSKNNIVTASTSSTQASIIKNGTGAMKFNGTSDYLQAPVQPIMQLGSANFTYELWVRTNAIGARQNIAYINGNTSGFAALSVNILTNGKLSCGMSETGGVWKIDDLTGLGTALSANTWYHVAVVRNGATITVYLDGASIGTYSLTTATTSLMTTYTLNQIGVYNTGYYYFNGYIDDLRITNGVARYTANFTPPQSLPNSSTGDEYFHYNSLLLQSDVRSITQPIGKNNIFIDSSSNNLAITPTGTPTQGTFSPFSQTGWSGYFAGTDYLTVASNSAFDLGTNDFTLEWWQNVADFSVNRNAITRQSSASGWNNIQWYGLTNTSNVFIFASSNGGGGSNFFATPAGVFTLNTWQHVAIVRHGGVWKMFVNGLAVTLGAGTGYAASMEENTVSQPLQIGGYPGWYNGPKGEISNVRLVKGTAVYTAAFTPSTTHLLAIAGTSLLTLQDSRFKDNSTNNFTITTTGAPSVQPVSPFAPTSANTSIVNGGSMYFNGTTDYVRSAVTTGFGTQNFTVEGWLYRTSSGSEYIFYDMRNGGNNNGPTLGITAAGLLEMQVTGAIVISGGSVPVNTWNHFAMCKTGGSTKLYLNGAQVGSTYVDSNNYVTPTRVHLGSDDDGSPNAYFAGYLSNVRVILGTAFYTTNFTPPTAPLTPIANTSLLLSGTNTGIADSSAKTDLVLVGGAKLDPNGKFGLSLSLNGATDYAYIPGINPNFAFGTGDLTVESWLFVPSISANQTIFDTNLGGDTTGTGRLSIDLITTGTMRAYTDAGTTQLAQTTSGAITINLWHHFAVVRSNGVWKIYINGTQSGTTTTNAVNIIANLNRPVIGANAYNLTIRFTGYLDNFRVTKGHARYTENFTPSTVPFPVL